MNGQELLRLIELITATKDIPREVVFLGLEDALAWTKIWL